MADSETTETLSALVLDRSTRVGNSKGLDGRGRVHVKVSNETTEPIPVLVQAQAIQVQTQLEGVFDAVTNTNPDNTGIIIHTRAAIPGDTEQVKRVTGIQGTAPNTVHAMDVSLHDENGNPYTITNPLPTNVIIGSGGSAGVAFFVDAPNITVIIGTIQTLLTTTVPALKKRALVRLDVSCRLNGRWFLEVDSVTIAAGNTGAANMNPIFEWKAFRTVAAASVITVKFDSFTGQPPGAKIDAYLQTSDFPE